MKKDNETLEERTETLDQRSEEMDEKLATGQITLAQFVGLSRQQLYEIAQQGYKLLNSGKLEEARQIYTGLVAADPYDSVFHCHLGATYQRMGESEKALQEYDAALRLNIANVDAFAGRGELYLQKGEAKKGIEDLRAAMENDPEAKHPATVRARALLLSLRDAAQKQSAS